MFHPRTPMIEASEGCGCVWNVCTFCKEGEQGDTREYGVVNDSPHLLASKSPTLSTVSFCFGCLHYHESRAVFLPLGKSLPLAL